MAIKKQASLTAGELGFDMTPMIDVVFQLLLFFITCVTMIETQTAADLILPLADQAQPPADNLEKELFVFNVVDLNKRNVKGEFIFRNISRDAPYDVGGRHMNLNALENQLRLAAERNRSRTGGKEVESAVIIRGDRDVAWSSVLAAMTKAQSVGFVKVYLKALLVEEK